MPITNITELVRCESTTAVLRQCGAQEQDIEPNSADYAYFQALCRAIPLLGGHPLVQTLARLFASMNIVFLPDHLDPAALWMQVVSYLEEQSVPKPNLCCKSNDKSTNYNFRTFQKDQSSVIDTVTWVNTSATSWCAWERELNARLESIDSTCGLLRFCLPLTASQLSVYHVNTALVQNNDQSTLSAQLLRFLCIACKQENKTLLVETEQFGGKDLLFHLQQLKKTVGLPNLIISVQCMDDLCKLLPFLSQPHDTNIVFGVQMQNGTSAISLGQLSNVYPIGRVFLYEQSGGSFNTFTIIANEKTHTDIL